VATAGRAIPDLSGVQAFVETSDGSTIMQRLMPASRSVLVSLSNEAR
jgi:hypothetical protein